MRAIPLVFNLAANAPQVGPHEFLGGGKLAARPFKDGERFVKAGDDLFPRGRTECTA